MLLRSRVMFKGFLARALLAILLLSSVVGLVALIKPVAASPETLICSPSEDFVFKEVSLTGTGWGYLSRVKIYFNSTEFGIFLEIREVYTNATGGFKIKVTVPPVRSGLYTWYAVEPGTTRAAKAIFTVKPGIGVSPEEGPVGTAVRIYGSAEEWVGGRKVCIIFDKDGDDRLDAGEILTNVTSTEEGVIDTNVVVPDVKSGSYYFYANKTTITIDGSLSGNSYSASFSVKAPVISIISITLDEGPEGPVCSSVRVSGNYFKIGSLVNITLTQDSTVKAVLATNVLTNATGGFVKMVTIPYCTPSGNYYINATDRINFAIATFRVSDPSIIISPSSAKVGEEITVEGNKFAVLRDVIIYFSIRRTATFYELVPVKTVATNATGGFKITVIVPEVPSDSGGVTDLVTINVTDGCNFKLTDFDVQASIRLSPVRGIPGDTVTVIGTGFRNETSVTIEFGGIVVGSTTTNRYGSFTVSFTVPAVPDGSYFVNASDNVNTASATFQVVAPELKMILDAIDEVEGKLDYIKPKIDSLISTIGVINSNIEAILYRMGAFTGTDTIASLLYDIKAEIAEISLDLTPVLDAITSAKTEILTAVSGLLTEEDFNSVMSAVTSSLSAINEKVSVINWSDILAIKGDVSYIKSKIEALSAAQATSGSGTTTTSRVIYTGTKVGTVTVSISTSGIGSGESVLIRYYIDPANPTLYITKTVTRNINTTGWTDTAAAWKVEIIITGTGTVNYAYSAITPP